MSTRWNRDELIIRSEVLGLQPPAVSTTTAASGMRLQVPVFVVDDRPETTTRSGTSGRPDRDFRCWYLNVQTAFVRNERGYETQDLELDLVVFADGTHIVKDEEVLDDRVAEGRYSPELVTWIRQYGQMLIRRLDSEGPWWDQSWAQWEPDPAWHHPAFPGS